MIKIDLRSDTLTLPTPQMREAMFSAEVGDDVFNEDPSINAFQEYAASYFGMEAALYCSSGTQTNQIAINAQTRPGDEVICSSIAHVYLYEGGGIAKNSGCSVRLLEGDRGRITAAQVSDNVNSREHDYLPYTSLVCLEDTVNKGGGAIYDFNEIKAIRKVCDENGLNLHLDGARLFNALVETKIDAKEYASHFDTMSICLSKGLGAPVGSLVLGTKEFISRAHRLRKSYGGGMRQAGFLAAAGLYAMQHQVERLKEDHAHARAIGQALQPLSWVADVLPVDTNIVIFQVRDGLSANDVVAKLAKQEIHCFTFGPDKIRFVTHLDFTNDHLMALLDRLSRIVI
jgi:threonine aldolase